MAPEQIKVDDHGIPVLEDSVSPDTLPATESKSDIDLTDHEQIDRLLREETLEHILEDLTEDLQKLVTWKIESFLKEELNKLIREAAEKSAPGLTEDIRTQLQLALPDLLAKIVARAKR